MSTETLLSKQTLAVSRESKVGDFIALLKPRVMSLVVFTGAIGFALAPVSINPVLGVIAICALAIGAGASGGINMWFDRDIDAIMLRTQNRPIPSGRVQPAEALAFSVILSGFSVMLMGLVANWVAAFWLLFAILFYAVFYTMILKRHTPQNIVIGGAAGAFPPMIGWAIATGDVTLAPLLLFTIIFLWTPPHFWALALYASDDFKRANLPMLPLVKGAKHTKIQMLIYTLVLAPVTLAMYWVLPLSPIYLGIAAFLNGLFILCAIQVLRSDDSNFKPHKTMFGYSIFYLFALFTALYVCHATL